MASLTCVANCSPSAAWRTASVAAATGVCGVYGGLGEDGPQGSDRDLAAAADGAGPGHVRPQLGHIDVVRDVHELPATTSATKT